MILYRQILTLLQLMFSTPIGQSGRSSLPSLANGPTATGAAGAWAYGAYVTVISASDKTVNFLVESLVMEAFTAGAVYQIDIATGAAGSEVVRATIRSGSILGRHPLGLGPYPAGTRVSVRIATKAGGAQTADFSLSTINFI